MQLGLPNSTQKCSTMKPGNPFDLGSKGQGHESQKYYRRGSLHSCECWLISVGCYFSFCSGCAARCNSTWIEHADSNVPDGTVIPFARNVPACQSACVRRANCTGFDFNPASPATSRCFLIFAVNPTINEGLTNGVTHYERVINCNDGGTIWNSSYDSELISRVMYISRFVCLFVWL